MPTVLAGRFREVMLLGAVSASAACSLVSGLDSLQKVECPDGCDGGADGRPGETADAAAADATDDQTGPDAPGISDVAVSGDSGPIADSANAPDRTAAQDASASDAMPALDAAEATDAAGVDAGFDATDAMALPDSPSIADATESGPTSIYAAAVMADSPLAYWRLGETNGSTTCVDQTGHGYDATVVGTVTLGVPGALARDPNTAVQVDGKSGEIDVGNTLDFPSPATFTWEVWVKPASLGSYREFMSRMTYNSSGNPVTGTYMFAWSGGGMNVGFERWVRAAGVLTVDTPGLTAGAWAHLVGTVDASGVGTLWVNGTQMGSAATTTSVPATTAHLIFGAALPCSLDEIAIYDHVLSAQSVTAHWRAATQ